MRAVALLRPEAVVLTPSYAAHLVEWAAERGVDLPASSVERILVAGEPGGGEPAFRAALEDGWGARVTEAMGIGDIGVSLWGECEAQDGMHLGARGFVHAGADRPGHGRRGRRWRTGPSGELVLTHLRHRAAPLLRFRTRDHVHVRTGPCPCGRTGPRVRCVGRTDDMLIVRGVNLFPAAVREVVSGFAPDVSGHVLVTPQAPGVKQEPPLPVRVELARGATADPALADAIRDRLRSVLVGADPRGARAVGEPAAQRVQVQARRALRSEPPMQKLQSQGVHHITIVGADRQTSIDFWEGVLGMPFVFEQPNLDNAAREPPLLRPRRRAPDHDLHERGARRPTRSRTPTDPGCVHHLAFAISQATFHQAVERLDERGIRHSGVKDRGFMDSIYFEDPLGLLIELASYRFEPPHGHTHADVLLEAHLLRVERGDDHIDRGPRRGRRSRRSPLRRAIALRRPLAEESRTTARRTDMAANTLNILKPSVNNLTARIFVRAAGLDFEEIDVWGKTDEPEFLAKDPAHLTPMLEEDGLPRGSLWESCAIMQYLCNKHGLNQFYPPDPGRAGDGRQRDVLPDRHALSARGARHLPGARLPAVPGRGRHLGGRRRRSRRRRSRTPRPRSPSRSTSTARSSSTARRSSAATRPRSPTSAWPRRSSSCGRSTTTSRSGPRST